MSNKLSQIKGFPPVLPPLSLKANFSWTFVGNLVYAVSQWGILVALAKLGNPDMVGQFALGLAVTAPVIMFSNLQLRAIQATDAKREFSFKDYLGLRIVMTLLALLVIGGITIVTDYKYETALVIVGVGIFKAFDAISDVFYGLMQQHERMDRIAKSKIVKGILSLLMLCAGIYLTGSVVVGVLGMCVAMLLRLLLYDVPSGLFILEAAGPDNVSSASIKPRFLMSAMKELFILALPLGLVMMLISLNTSIPRYVLERNFGERELGIFASMAYLLTAGSMIVSALGQAASPRLARYYLEQKISAFRKILLYLLGIGVLLGIVGILISIFAGAELLTFFYTAEYAQSTDVLELIMIAAAVGYLGSFMGYGMTAARRFKVQLPLFLAVTATTGVASLYLIPKYALRGAGFALITGAVVQLIGSSGVIVHALATTTSLRDSQAT